MEDCSHVSVSRNFLEGDFFGWYLSAWNPGIADAVRDLARSLGDFEPATGSLEPSATRDLLKRLYQYLVPGSLRHDLGEYYTPDWLAELTVDESGYRGKLDERFLDPACGSGTFLVLAIKRAREAADSALTEPQDTLDGILRNVVGFDLNPLAVIASRTNYLLALGTLVRFGTSIEIPVYLCDSVLTPSTAGADGGQLLQDYTIRSTVGPFSISASLVAEGGLGSLSELIEECAPLDYEESEFADRLRGAMPGLDEPGIVGATNLFVQIRDLERQGRNGIWARVVERVRTAVCREVQLRRGQPTMGPVGVSEDEYRAATLDLWTGYGLFSLTGISARLGGGEKDFSMLFLYASADAYLESGGVLSFVITQEVLKGKGAGRGFRRFRIGEDGDPLEVLKAHDLVTVQPFEGAANKTAVLVIRKGQGTTYPVPYELWSRLPGSVELIPKRRSTVLVNQRNGLSLLRVPSVAIP